MAEQPDAGPARPEPKGPDVELQIITSPHGGRISVDGSFGGPDGTTFRRPRGTTVTFTCKQYDKGKVVASGKLRIKFGDTLMAICEMRSIAKRKCLEETKNPFDDC